ncbi:MAG: ribokinase [Actinomycetota bacterium]|nr:ribokinase [Actinomycetota bacterium]MDZ4178802.1 ribokinase [Coriobacteriia bacterium]
MSEVVVVGSINVDRAVEVPSALERGATLLGADVHRGPGGKGANQAVALARLGRDVGMLGAVGADADGDWMLGILADEGVDTGGITRSEAPTGQAFVFVEPGGESTIVVAPGANGALSAAGLDGLADRIAAARCVLAQQEVPADVVARASELCRGMFVLNPAPARPISPEVLQRVDVLVPNRHELAALADVPGTDDITALAEMAKSLEGPRIVVVTLGAHGALVVDEGGTTHVPAIPVDAIDATAAGDTFCAALTDGLLNGASAIDATRWAVRVAALTVQRRGAMDSIPRRDEVDRTTDRD